jgi:hypothetical protein
MRRCHTPFSVSAAGSAGNLLCDFLKKRVLSKRSERLADAKLQRQQRNILHEVS